MQRRAFLKTGAAASLGIAIGGCATGAGSRGTLRSSALRLVPPAVSWDRIIRTTVGLRPFRESGFRLEAERLDDRTVIHNYGHGGAGMSLSWGTGRMAADLALDHTERRAAVIGCGIVGLTSARQLQRRGFDVTLYAAALPPETTSNMSFAGFTPTSGLVSPERLTPEWEALFRRAVEIAYREHQLLVGRGYGVSWMDHFTATDDPAGGRRGAFGAGTRLDAGAGVDLGRVVLEPGEHPFGTRYAARQPVLRFEPSIYLDALMKDVLAFGGRIVVRSFDTPKDLAALPEPVIVNCTGLGSKELFGDEELNPVKGQLVVLVPQPEIDYSAGGMLPRSDGIVLGHVSEPGVWSLDVNEDEKRRVVETHLALFASMRWPEEGARRAAPGPRTAGTSVPPAQPPPVESFFDLVS